MPRMIRGAQDWTHNLMQKIGFAEALDSIVATDPRYSRGAF